MPHVPSLPQVSAPYVLHFSVVPGLHDGALPPELDPDPDAPSDLPPPSAPAVAPSPVPSTSRVGKTSEHAAIPAAVATDVSRRRRAFRTATGARPDRA
jgi:hypothetical protein